MKDIKEIEEIKMLLAGALSPEDETVLLGLIVQSHPDQLQMLIQMLLHQ